MRAVYKLPVHVENGETEHTAAERQRRRISKRLFSRFDWAHHNVGYPNLTVGSYGMG